MPSGPGLAIVAAHKSRKGLLTHTDIAFYGIVTAGRFAPGQQRSVFMKLTRLRLHGFKSFVEPTDFMIEPGLTQAQVEDCLKDQALLDKIAADQKFAAEVLKVQSTPTFFINGEMLKGEQSFEEFSKRINSMLKS